MLMQLAITGLLVALLPLSLVWVSSDANKYRKLVLVTLFLAFDLIMVGGFTRLSDSGLGCPDWPGCYGHANPLQANVAITAAEAALPSGPVTQVKAWIEMLHRYFAMAIGVLITALTLIAWRRHWRKERVPDARFSPWYPSFLLGFVCLVGAFGALTVTQKLQPIIVTGHLMLALGLLACVAWLAARVSSHGSQDMVDSAALNLRPLAGVAAALLFVQIALGGWVSTNYAAVACTDYPLCQGVFLPPMDFVHGFTLWRKLGMTGSGDYLPFAALTAIHWTHRMFAILVAAALFWLGYRAMQITGLRRTGRWLMLAVALQCATGLLTIFLQWPLLLALLHNGGAALLVLLMTMLNYQLRIPAASAVTSAQRAASEPA